MTTWYETPNAYGWDITPVEVEKETENFIWIGKSRRAKSSAYDTYYPTLKEAKKHLLERCERTIEDLKEDLEEAEEALIDLKK